MFEYQISAAAFEGSETSGEPVSVCARKFAASGDAWDDFAKACDASFRCSFTATSLWQLEHHVLSRLERFELMLQVGRHPIKIGQCAVGRGRSRIIFADTIQLLPAFESFWPECMQALLQYLGPGRYQYGSEWTLAPCRAEEIRGLAGVGNLNARSVDVQAIDFSEWPTFEDYYKSVSTNARRNVKKAAATYDQLVVHEQRSAGVFVDLLPLQLLRYRLFRRKGVRASLAGLVLRSAFRTLATAKYTFSVSLANKSLPIARYLGIEFGRNSYYLESAAGADHPAASSHLLKLMVSRAFEHGEGRGKFVMGPDDYRQHGQAAWDGLVRSRKQWKATPHPTSVVSFVYAPVF